MELLIVFCVFGLIVIIFGALLYSKTNYVAQHIEKKYDSSGEEIDGVFLLITRVYYNNVVVKTHYKELDYSNPNFETIVKEEWDKGKLYLKRCKTVGFKK